MVQLVQEKPLRLLSLLSFGEIPACPGDRYCLPTRAVSFKFDETPGAEPSPAAIGLFDPVFHFVAAVARGIERLRNPRPHELQILGMEFALHALFVVQEARTRQAIESLGVLIVDADVVREGV